MRVAWQGLLKGHLQSDIGTARFVVRCEGPFGREPAVTRGLKRRVPSAYYSKIFTKHHAHAQYCWGAEVVEQSGGQKVGYQLGTKKKGRSWVLV